MVTYRRYTGGYIYLYPTGYIGRYTSGNTHVSKGLYQQDKHVAMVTHRYTSEVCMWLHGRDSYGMTVRYFGANIDEVYMW